MNVPVPSSTDAAAFLAAIVESSDNAIVGKSLDGRILSWNAAAERIFGWPADEIIGRNVRLIIPADRQAEEDAIVATISRGKRYPSFETVRQRKDGSLVHVAVTVSPVLDAKGKVIAASKIARDITNDLGVQERLAVSEERFRLLADNMRQLAWIAGEDGQVLWFNKRWYDYTGLPHGTVDLKDRLGVHDPDLLPRISESFRASRMAGEDWEETFPLRSVDGEWRWFLTRVTPIRDDSGIIVYWFGTHTDVTDMRDAEKRIELLLQEVNHRSKNMLAIIQSLARRADLDRSDFIERLEQRIRGLAANQDLLVRGAWSPVQVNEMIEAQLRSFADARSQIDVHGAPVLLSPGSAEALAMAIHEMATNATKYGALSVPEGRVDIRWETEKTAEGEQFKIVWIETGGPPVSEPARRGFGSRIMVDVPRVKLEADVRAQYLPEGFHWSLSCAASSLH